MANFPNAIPGSFAWLHDNNLIKQNGLCLNPDYVTNHKVLDAELNEKMELLEPFNTRKERATARRALHDKIYLAKVIVASGQPYTV